MSEEKHDIYEIGIFEKLAEHSQADKSGGCGSYYIANDSDLSGRTEANRDMRCRLHHYRQRHLSNRQDKSNFNLTHRPEEFMGFGRDDRAVSGLGSAVSSTQLPHSHIAPIAVGSGEVIEVTVTNELSDEAKRQVDGSTVTMVDSPSEDLLLLRSSCRSPERSNDSSTDIIIRNEGNKSKYKCMAGPVDRAPIPPWLEGVDVECEWWRRLGFFEKLHEEIVLLVKWLEPTPLETRRRQETVARLTVTSQRLWPNCTVKPFGSYYTGLWLPNGDLDICLMESSLSYDPPQATRDSREGYRGKHDTSAKRALKILALELNQYSFTRGVEDVKNAKVPIVKYVDAYSGIPVDVSINQNSAMTTSAFVRDNLAKFVMLRPLLMLLKVFLQQRGQNETFRGSIGSYLLFVLTLNFLQLHPSSHDPTLHGKVGLGVLFYEILYYYGKMSNFRNRRISVAGAGYFKAAWIDPHSTRPHLLQVESPLDESVDLGKNSYNIQEVRDSLMQSWGDLLDKCIEVSKLPISQGVCPSFLALVIRTDDPLFLFRSRKLYGGKSHLRCNPVGILRPMPDLPSDLLLEVDVNTPQLVGKRNRRRSRQGNSGSSSKLFDEHRAKRRKGEEEENVGGVIEDSTISIRSDMDDTTSIRMVSDGSVDGSMGLFGVIQNNSCIEMAKKPTSFGLGVPITVEPWDT